jgi:hypothetical protein
LYGDNLVETLRQDGFRIYLTMFGFNPPFPNLNGSTPQEEASLKRYIKYVVARYGAYTDMWELMNEATVTNHWIGITTSYLRSIDPYNRLIGTSWEQPANPNIDIDAPHWYEKESELQSDTRTTAKIDAEKPNNKPIIFGEQGNSVQNWDSLSALRMRIRSWTAFFDEGIFCFWNSSFAKDYFSGAANIYLGPIERGYIHAMQNFTSLADSSVNIFTLTPSNANEVRGYGLKSDSIILCYFHHYATHDAAVTTSCAFTVPNPSTVYWINPSNDSLLASYTVPPGSQTLTSPMFDVDMALRISRQTISTGFITTHFELNEIMIYPNPAHDEFTLQFLPGGEEEIQLSLYNPIGELIYNAPEEIKDKIKVSTKNFSAGVYLLKIQQSESITMKKIVVQ